MLQLFSSLTKSAFAAAGLLGMVSFLQPTEDPGKCVKEFADLFITRDAKNIVKRIYPEVMADADINPSDVENFVKRFNRDSLRLDSFSIEKRFKDEEGTTERFQSTLVFSAPQLVPEYGGPSSLRMTLLWVLSNGRWWLERPLAVERVVVSNAGYPTASQDETAMRFEAAMEILKKIGPTGSIDLVEAPTPLSGNAANDYKELIRLYPSEMGAGGIAPTAGGVQVLLRAATRSVSGLLELYRGDFPAGSKDERSAVPWDMFRDYVEAAIRKGRLLETEDDVKSAENVYRAVIALGRQITRERGGFQFVHWGATFEKRGAEELARMLPGNRRAEKEQTAALASLLSRRLDTLQTALNCLDKMEDYNSLSAAIVAARRDDDPVFKPLAVSTLSILAFKGAPANAEAMKAGEDLVLVKNPLMQKIALEVLVEIAGEPSGRWKSFVEFQKQWVQRHNVYGTVTSFR